MIFAHFSSLCEAFHDCRGVSRNAPTGYILLCGDRLELDVVLRHLTEGEDGYSLEVFNAIGETIAVVTVAESEIEALSPNEVLHVRVLEAA